MSVVDEMSPSEGGWSIGGWFFCFRTTKSLLLSLLPLLTAPSTVFTAAAEPKQTQQRCSYRAFQNITTCSFTSYLWLRIDYTGEEGAAGEIETTIPPWSESLEATILAEYNKKSRDHLRDCLWTNRTIEGLLTLQEVEHQLEMSSPYSSILFKVQGREVCAGNCLGAEVMLQLFEYDDHNDCLSKDLFLQGLQEELLSSDIGVSIESLDEVDILSECEREDINTTSFDAVTTVEFTTFMEDWNDSDIEALEALYLETYNRLNVPYGSCKDVTLTASIILMLTNVTTLDIAFDLERNTTTIEFQVTGSCQNCQDDTMIFVDYGFLIEDNEITQDQMFGPPTSSHTSRPYLPDIPPILLEEEHNMAALEHCYCSVDPSHRHGVAEHEFLQEYRDAVEGWASVEACEPTTLVDATVALWVASSRLDQQEDLQTILEDAFFSAANRFVQDPNSCDPNRRLIVQVTSRVGRSVDSNHLSESLLPSKTPSLAPLVVPSLSSSSLPTSALFENDLAILMHVTMLCRGCEDDSFFFSFNDEDAESSSYNVTTEIVDEDDVNLSQSTCFCPIGSRRVVETEEALIEAINVDLNGTSVSVLRAHDAKLIDCLPLSYGEDDNDDGNEQSNTCFCDRRGDWCENLHASKAPSLTPSTSQPSSINPSETPTGKLSSLPSDMPSSRPSDTPSSIPSQAPSSSSSYVPSDIPSSVPSETSSSFPSGAPTSSISAIPSETPTRGSSSAFPSKKPSSSSSSYPSDILSSIPSDVPSSYPSQLPSSIPSEVPPSMASQKPNSSISSYPSDIPSAIPGDLPSSVPSAAPSFIISDVPSAVPSDAPSSSSSSVPSRLPSFIPSDMPSSIPSDVPSSYPSDIPSFIASDVPSAVTSDAPSSRISSVPSDEPSYIFSESPSSIPSEAPSSRISSVPSDVASTIPSDMPSSIPSEAPSYPSDKPSFIASEAPSSIPSAVPSSSSSSVPSDIPSSTASDVPSSHPTITPSSSISYVGSETPSISSSSSYPSDLPSTIPSDVPSSIPSDIPSTIPSDMPSTIPSDVPSSLPSEIPTAAPSCIQPSSCVVGQDVCKDAIDLCTLDNSCYGNRACMETLNVTVGHTSCLRTQACQRASRSFIGDFSCIEENACKQMNASVVGGNSCVVQQACQDLFNTMVANNSCNTGEASCQDIRNSAIGVESCRRSFGCQNSTNVEIGDRSCQGRRACDSSTRMAIGNDACDEDESCRRNLNVQIGSQSCNEIAACANLTNVEIGENACNAFQACSCMEAGATVFDNECNTEGECCPHSTNCQGLNACENAFTNALLNPTRNSCNGRSACLNLGRNENVATSSGMTIGSRR